MNPYDWNNDLFNDEPVKPEAETPAEPAAAAHLSGHADDAGELGWTPAEDLPSMEELFPAQPADETKPVYEAEEPAAVG